MIRIRSPKRKPGHLDQAFREETDPKYKDRIQIVRLASRDRPRPGIANDLAHHREPSSGSMPWSGDSTTTAAQAKGAPGKIPATLADEVLAVGSSTRTCQAGARADRQLDPYELADPHLYKTHGIATSRSAMQRFCQKIGIRVYRPTYRFLRGKA